MSLAKVNDQFRVMYDSGNSDGFMVHKPDGKKRCFKESRKGLFFHNACSNDNQDAAALVNKAEDKKNNTPLVIIVTPL